MTTKIAIATRASKRYRDWKRTERVWRERLAEANAMPAYHPSVLDMRRVALAGCNRARVESAAWWIILKDALRMLEHEKRRDAWQWARLRDAFPR